MTTLGERNYALISQGIKGTGSYNPKDNFYWFEEQLYVDEIDLIYEFLVWCHIGGTEKHPHIPELEIPKRGFGSGNYEQRFQEFLIDRETYIREFEDHLNSDPQFNYSETEYLDWFTDMYLC